MISTGSNRPREQPHLSQSIIPVVDISHDLIKGPFSS
jgi:hypothetical protein